MIDKLIDRFAKKHEEGSASDADLALLLIIETLLNKVNDLEERIVALEEDKENREAAENLQFMVDLYKVS